MMQYSTFPDLKKGTIFKSGFFKRESSKVILAAVKVIALLCMIYFIERKLSEGQLSLSVLISLSRRIYEAFIGIWIAIPLALVVANWGLEARKWQLLSAPVIKMSYMQATRGVLTGLGLGFITPRSVGDYAGRILESPGSGRERLIGAVMVNRISQALITYSAGLVALAYLYLTEAGFSFIGYRFDGIFVVIFSLVLILILFKGRTLLLRMVLTFKKHRVFRFLQIISLYQRHDLYKIIGLSFLRYMAFTSQFVLILWAAEIGLPFVILTAGVAVTFLLKSVIPTFNFLSDLGVREFSALLAFSFFSVQENQLITASLFVWFLNVLIPTVLGGVNILRLRLSRIRC